MSCKTTTILYSCYRHITILMLFHNIVPIYTYIILVMTHRTQMQNPSILFDSKQLKEVVSPYWYSNTHVIFSIFKLNFCINEGTSRENPGDWHE